MAIAQEKPIIIACIISELILKIYNSLPRPKSKDMEFPSCCSHFFVKFSQL